MVSSFSATADHIKRQLRAQASRVAPRSCLSAASALFQGLDPNATGAITASKLAYFVSRLVGLSPEGGAEHSPRTAHEHRTAAGLWSETPRSSTTTGAPRGTATVGEIIDRRSSRTGSVSFAGEAVPRSTSLEWVPSASSSFHGSSCAFNHNRTRRLYGVIERLAKTAGDSCLTKGESFGERDGKRFVRDNRYRHGEQQGWVQQGDCNRTRTSRGSAPREQKDVTVAAAVLRPPSGSEPSTFRSGREARDDVGEIFITLSTFCRFVEGNKFGSCLEGCLRALSRAGRQPESLSVCAVAIREDSGETRDQASFSASTERRRMSRIVDGARGRTGTVGWGRRGGRRGSLQLANNTLAAKDKAHNWVATSSLSRDATKTSARPGTGVGCSSSARSSSRGGGGAGGGYLSSSSGSSTTSGGFTDAPRDAISGRRGGSFVALALFSVDVNGSGTLSSAEFVSAASKVTHQSVRQEWGDVLVTRFAAGIHEKEGIGEGASCTRGSGYRGGGGGVRWLGAGMDRRSNSSRLDVAALVDFLRPISFSLSVMTPFGEIGYNAVYPPYRAPPQYSSCHCS